MGEAFLCLFLNFFSLINASDDKKLWIFSKTTGQFLSETGKHKKTKAGTSFFPTAEWPSSAAKAAAAKSQKRGRAAPSRVTALGPNSSCNKKELFHYQYCTVRLVLGPKKLE